MQVEIEYGDGHLTVEVPDDSVVVAADRTDHEPPPLTDPVAATRAALDAPLGCAPITGLVRPGQRVTIAFPDRVKGGAHETAHRRVVLPQLLDDPEQAGVAPEDIRLVCAIGLHRKNRWDEFEAYLGAETMARLPRANIVNHDAEDPDEMVDLGVSALGDPVQVNRAVIESDLAIMIGHTAGNPYGGFSGGYKMPATGLTSWRSIASHHAPRSLYRDDFVPVSTRSRFQRPAPCDRAADGGGDAAAVLHRRCRPRLEGPPARGLRRPHPRGRAGVVAAGDSTHRPRGRRPARRRAAHRHPPQLPLRPGHGLQPDPDDAGRRLEPGPRQACPRSTSRSSSPPPSATAGSTAQSSRHTLRPSSSSSRASTRPTWSPTGRRWPRISTGSTATATTTATTRSTRSR
ncbi:nickel-dependent lactate racemase [Nocardioides sp. B-3]|uniref:nickel-dependent lactate racemase n=1 Tax=Nocardioides sp. B-3 TaxID=2895565 RepID=UPI00215392BE|nr:nickel-dependent lactate racemase [Nocardioides sp. B-3]UUZ58408.1 nickel-dependent lactate racemase [Nocardioides sp. B-3]